MTTLVKTVCASLLTLYLTPSNLLTPKTTQPKPYFYHCLISQMLSLTNMYPAFVFSISLLPLVPLITPSYFIVFLVGSAYPLLSNGSTHTCLTHMSLPFHLFLPHPLSFVVCCKALSFVPSSLFTLLSAL